MCGGDGAQKRMADAQARTADAQVALSNREQDLAEQQWAEYQRVFAPYSQQMVDEYSSVLPLQGALARLQAQSEINLAPEREAATKAGLDDYLKEMQLASPVVDKFYAEAAKGPGYEEKMGQAGADVGLSFAGAEGQLSRSLARMGAAPGSGASSAAMTQLALGKALGTAGARTKARRDADTDYDARLGMGINALRSVSGSGALPFSSSTMGNPNAANTTTAAQLTQGFFGGAASGLSAASSSYGSAGQLYGQANSGGIGSAFGSLLGTGVGAFTGGIGSQYAKSLFK